MEEIKIWAVDGTDADGRSPVFELKRVTLSHEARAQVIDYHPHATMTLTTTNSPVPLPTP